MNYIKNEHDVASLISKISKNDEVNTFLKIAFDYSLRNIPRNSNSKKDVKRFVYYCQSDIYSPTSIVPKKISDSTIISRYNDFVKNRTKDDMKEIVSSALYCLK